jgi:lycopene cyclase domain-containing protein
MRGEYFLLLVVSLTSVVILDRVARLGVIRQWRRLLVALIPTTAAILLWDLLGVERWRWDSNDRVLLGPHGFGGRVPLEEFLFPVVVAVCALVLWELITTRVGGRDDDGGRR